MNPVQSSKLGQNNWNPVEPTIFQASNFQESIIKVLSIVRPNGGRIASGEKTLEVRRWHPDLDPSEDLLIVENGRFLHTDGDEDNDGIVVAIVRVKAVRPFVLADMQAACASNFEDGWLAWELSDIRPVTQPVTMRAARGIYEVDF
ncbi:ASCH domain-containing protein [Pseudomonas sp. PCH199]|uniref:ASCH domain-containing protein n=1 Tax=unclassified Pseudomonas TaxID=196821 RepID=UPI002ADDF79C|nr:ASCH domain-containing protein [Pseudomonas sp. PCH199]